MSELCSVLHMLSNHIRRLFVSACFFIVFPFSIVNLCIILGFFNIISAPWINFPFYHTGKSSCLICSSWSANVLNIRECIVFAPVFLSFLVLFLSAIVLYPPFCILSENFMVLCILPLFMSLIYMNFCCKI